jgi:branched-chain amino acid transport system permease protein
VLVASLLVGGLLGAIVGPIALRLEGNYLAIVTIGLMFLGYHLLNTVEAFSGGTTGMRARFPMAIGPIDFNPLSTGAKVDLFGSLYTKTQARFWLLWLFVALVALVAKNVVRTRPGRAMQAIRDRDMAAEVVGVSLLRYKVGAFALSSAFTAFAGALFATLVLGSIRPDQFGAAAGLVISIQFVAIIIVGGMGTIYGSILGALVIAGLPGLISRISSSLPFLKQGSDDWGIMTAG